MAKIDSRMCIFSRFWRGAFHLGRPFSSISGDFRRFEQISGDVRDFPGIRRTFMDFLGISLNFIDFRWIPALRAEVAK